MERVEAGAADLRAAIFDGPGDAGKAVELAAQALNLQTDDPRGWTITGAHMSHGAPGAGCEWPPRLAPRSSGLVVSFGWMLHLWGV